MLCFKYLFIFWVLMLEVPLITAHQGANYEYCVQYSSGETTFLPVFCKVSFESHILLMIYLEYFSHMTQCFRSRFWLKLNILSLGMVSPPTGELNKSCPTFVCRQKLKSVFYWREFSPMYFCLIHVTETLLD